MLIGEQGLLDSILRELFGIDGPIWFNHRWLALASNIVAYIWKWMPLWTVIFLAGRMAIPREIYEAADVDGATGTRRFVHVTFPLLANVYLVCTLLSTIWTLGDFNGAYLVSGGAPAMSTDVLATFGIRYAFDARPARARRSGNVIGPAGADPAGDRADAQGPGNGGSVVSVAPSFGWPARRARYRMRRILTEAASAALGVVLLVWSLLPVYNMLLDRARSRR